MKKLEMCIDYWYEDLDETILSCICSVFAVFTEHSGFSNVSEKITQQESMPTSWSQTISEWREDIYFVISNSKGS